MSEIRQPTFLWGGRPVFRCGHCPYERVENLDAVLKHEAEAHAPVVHESPILGPDGAPLMVAETVVPESEPKQGDGRKVGGRRKVGGDGHE